MALKLEQKATNQTAFKEKLYTLKLQDETACVKGLIEAASLDEATSAAIEQKARHLVEVVRKSRGKQSGIEAFLNEYALSSKEGVVLMCLAEAMLRIPDSYTIDKLIEDKIGSADWERHLGKSESMFVNASTWALMLTGDVLRLEEGERRDAYGFLRRLVKRSGEPVIRQAVRQAMRIMGHQFVMGRTIEDALKRGKDLEKRGYTFSFDMLGEAAKTQTDADAYYEAYHKAIVSIGKGGKTHGEVIRRSGISIKLSALHPRYEFAQSERVKKELTPRLQSLALAAAKADIPLCVDAEEADRFDLSLEIIDAVAGDPDLKTWQGFGLALQAYQKRAFAAIDYLGEMATRHKRVLNVRLVKGAYWDSEIKWAQVLGLSGYPVFTRKAYTDVSYLACAKKLLDRSDVFFPQFATHNAHTMAAVLEMARERGALDKIEFQRLHGMGESLHEALLSEEKIPSRIYAPVGSHEELLPYLVRRLLENGANTSFVNRIQDDRQPIAAMIQDPVVRAREYEAKPHPYIPLPEKLYGDTRKNSRGIDLTNPAEVSPLMEQMQKIWNKDHIAGPILSGKMRAGDGRLVLDPSDRSRQVGRVEDSTSKDISAAFKAAYKAREGWDATAVKDRAVCLQKAADLLEADYATFMALCVREGGKTIPDALAEVREAVDFCRYYAWRCRHDFARPEPLPGPTGELNQLSLHARGVFFCISPWNFPLAIFMGQVTAALAAGNTVLAKPAEQTSLIAAEAVHLLHKAGIPGDVLHLLPGDGASIGGEVLSDPRLAGVAFTGSSDTAWVIQDALARRRGPIIPFIAETGGVNAMIVDSSALPEQVVRDVITSAFQSAGQRCSALRILYIQEDVADTIETMLLGAMDELRVGDPAYLSTDVGPVIDEEARSKLLEHAKNMPKQGGTLLKSLQISNDQEKGLFVPPTAFELDSPERLREEVFGPMLHIVRFQGEKLDNVIAQINESQFGLTLGIHSRVEGTVEKVCKTARVGNIYANRNMIGAIVGVQPFGGEGLSGTGPKAGGPHYLHRFATERALSVDTTASGGNASLMTLQED